MNKRVGPILLAAAVVLSGCQAEGLQESGVNDDSRSVRPEDLRPVDELPTLEAFPGILSEGGAPEDVYTRPPLAPVTPLDESRVQALLGRLEPLPSEDEDTRDFALRPGSQPPPRTGETVRGEFPPPEERAPPTVEVPDGPLKVLRFSPEGEVAMAGRISVTFDRPMVAVTAHDDAVSASAPVVVTPEIAGAWRWVGTRTLVFEPETERLPMATDFTVSVPAGAEAADGSALEQETRWAFQTPPLELGRAYPQGGGNRLDPLIFLEFNQRIEPERLRESITVRAEKGGAIPARLATEDEIGADETVASLVERARDGYWMVLRVERPLPGDSAIRVIVARKAPSAEGPLRTASDQEREFHTYGPFRVTEHRCGWQERCAPEHPLILTFSNDFDKDILPEDFIDVSPPIPGLIVNTWGRSISIEGWKDGRQRYEVTVSPDLRDEFGQSLEGRRQFVFNVGSSPPRLVASNAALLTLDPAAAPVFEFHGVNYASVAVEIRRVEPGDWPEYLEARRGIWNRSTPPRLPGRVVFDDRVPIEGKPDEIARVAIDLAPYLNEAGAGQLIVFAEADEVMHTVAAPKGRLPRVLTWVQATKIGLDVFADGEEVLVWTTDLLDGGPMPNVGVTIDGNGGESVSDAQGLARLAPLTEDVDTGQWIEAHAGGDIALLPSDGYGHQQPFRKRQRTDELRWFVFDDRAMYRPSEEVHLKGWVRAIERRKGGDLRLAGAGGTMRYEVFDSRNNPVAEGETEIGALGGFDLSFELPGAPNLGQAWVELRMRESSELSGSEYRHHFRIEEFRTPEFEVSTAATEGPFFAGEPAALSVNAAYYAGGPLPGAQVNWRVGAEPAHYGPPNRPEWEFGILPPPWWWIGPPGSDERVSSEFAGVTDGAGEHHLDIDFDEFDTLRPVAVTATATVMDVNRQAWTSSSNLLIHAAAAYVGLRTETYFVERGEPLEVELIVTDLEGEALVNRSVVVRAAREKHGFWRGGEAEVEDPQTCTVTTDEEGRANCTFETETGGRYRITAVTMDDQDRRNVTRITRWVSGGPSLPARDRVEIEDMQLIPGRDEYAPGDMAKVLVQAPFENAEGLMLINRHGMVEQRRFEVTGTTATLEIPVRHDWLPGVELQVTLVGSAPRDDDESDDLPPRPAIAKGTLELPVSTAERVLDVAVTPETPRLAPGEDAQVRLAVRDQAGNPVDGAEVALVVVDEAILALSDYALGDPMDVFYRLWPGGVYAGHSRSTIELASAEALLSTEQADFAKPVMEQASPAQALEKNSVTGGRARDQSAAAVDEAEPIDVRTDFSPLAAFVPSLTTDEQGRAIARFKLPDNLTRYRIMVVAVEGATHFGTGESVLTARLPLMVRPSPPRFLNFGDKFEFPVVLQNQTDETMTVDVALDARNLALSGARGYRAEVPPNDRVEVRFPAAPENAGTARFQVAAAVNGRSDAARGELPVWTPATTEAFATYGVIDEGAMVQPVAAPSDVWPQFGQLEVTTSSTAVQSLTDAFIYLYDYPFECTEQAASRLLSIAALRDVLEAFEAEGMPEPEEIEARVSADIELLATRQNPDGGFGLWRSGVESWPYVTLHAAHALVRARAKGYGVPGGMFDRTLNHVRDIERHIPERYGDWSRRHISAYALYVRALAGDRDPDKARSLLAEVDDLSQLSFESIGWLLAVLTGDGSEEVDALRRFLANRVTETAAGATFASAQGQADGYLVMHSSRRADGVILEALIDDQPESDLIPKLVHALQAHRTRGRWGNTQENAFVLLALDKYFNRFEDQTPDFVARTWLGEDYAGEYRFEGRTTDRHHVDIPMSWVASGDGRRDLTLDKNGAGRLYYRVGLRYAPRSLELQPAAHGFEVQRRYLAVEDDDDVRQRDDGVWEIRAGARVKIELDLVAPARRHHVALVDPLPAGLESINPALAVSEPIEDENNRPFPARHWWWGPWYEHQNLRDERTEAFASLLPGGVYTYSYYARATTPGEYVVPPARAEEMYEPETFGRTGTDRVMVVGR